MTSAEIIKKIKSLEAENKAITQRIEKLKDELTKNENKTVGDLSRGDKYLYFYTTGDILENEFEGNEYDDQLFNIGNMFIPKRGSEEHLEWYRDNVLRVQNKLMQLHELLCPDYFPDWENNNKSKVYLYYNYKNNTWNYDSWSTCCDYVVYFTKEAAEKACEILNREKFMMKG